MTGERKAQVTMIEEPMNQLFQFLRTSFRAVGEAHRTNPRRHTSTSARLSWPEREKRLTVRARLVDVSRAGAALITAAAPPINAQACLRLVGPEPTPWIEADILGVETESAWRYRVRLKFREPCPTYFLRVAVLGPVPEEEASEAESGAATIREAHAMTLPTPSSPSSTGSIAR
jgi:hypothetical protein